MKNLLAILMIVSIFFSFSCGSTKGTHQEKKKVTKENLLEGLHIPNMKSGIPSNFLSKDIPAYTEEAEEVPLEEMKKKASAGEYNMMPYVNDKNEMVLWLCQRLSEEEKKKMVAGLEDGEFKRNNLPNLKGKIAMPFNVTDMSGTQYALKDLKGKIIVMNFWFIGCKPCVMEIPDLNVLVDKYKGKGVVFLGFALDKKDELTTFLKKTPFKYSIIPESRSVSDSYRVNVFPANLIVDQQSTITYYAVGLDNNTGKNMSAEIERLLKKIGDI